MNAEELKKIDRRDWYALSMPVNGVRFDADVLAQLDSDHDGRVRIDEVLENADKIAPEKFDVFLRNYLSMEALYNPEEWAIFQMGTLRIDAKELTLCFDVADEEAHAALVGESKCCIIYLKLTRPAEEAERHLCAAVTAGHIGGLYIGRNGVFSDRDGKEWEAVITRIVPAQVSLAEAFWSPWKKLGDAVMSMVEKFIGDKQVSKPEDLKALAQGVAAKPDPKAASTGNGAALASSVAAIGIAIGMVGAASASVLAAASRLTWWQCLIAVVAIFFAVSLPSVILAWFKLRRRDLAAILNASGWAINRPMRFSMRLAKTFTRIR